MYIYTHVYISIHTYIHIHIYYKSDVTFVLANYYCVRTSLPLMIIVFAFIKDYGVCFCNRFSLDDGPKSGRKY